jgi:hypothetical protein
MQHVKPLFLSEIKIKKEKFMKRLILFGSFFMVLVLAACGGTSAPQQAVEEGDGPLVTVYRAPT